MPRSRRQTAVQAEAETLAVEAAQDATPVAIATTESAPVLRPAETELVEAGVMTPAESMQSAAESVAATAIAEAAAYPTDPAQIIDMTAKYPGQVLRTVKAFARTKPWQGMDEEKKAKFEALLAGLAAYYGIEYPSLRLIPGLRCAGNYSRTQNEITLGKWSVVTLFHEFCHARGMVETEACKWSVNLFRRCFPRSWENCELVGHMVVRRSEAPAMRSRYEENRRMIDQLRQIGEAVANESRNERGEL
jgi:hypothetical protein